MRSKLKIISSMLIFGSIGVFVKNMRLTSLEIAFLRAVIGSLFLVCTSFLIRKNISLKNIKENLMLLILSGTAIGFNWILLFQGYKYTTISNATLSYYFAPVFVTILAPFILKEKLTWKKLLYICVAMMGLFLILNAGGTGNKDYDHLRGILYGLSAAILYASVILINKFIKDLSGFETTLIQLMVAALVLLPGLLLSNGFNLSEVPAGSWLLIVVLGIVHTGIAYFLYFTAMKDLKSQSIAILSYIDPISAVIFAAIFLEEAITISQIIGGVLILGSAFLSEKVKGA